MDAGNSGQSTNNALGSPGVPPACMTPLPDTALGSSVPGKVAIYAEMQTYYR
jgi:hypothetical protein